MISSVLKGARRMVRRCCPQLHLIDEHDQPEDDVDLIYRDSDRNKPRHARDLLLNVVDMASNRVAGATKPRARRVADESRGVVA